MKTSEYSEIKGMIWCLILLTEQSVFKRFDIGIWTFWICFCEKDVYINVRKNYISYGFWLDIHLHSDNTTYEAHLVRFIGMCCYIHTETVRDLIIGSELLILCNYRFYIGNRMFRCI